MKSAKKSLAERVVTRMYNSDPFSRWLGIKRIKIRPGHCVLRMKIRKEMLNGFAIAHGGISFSLADSALAFASNSYGVQCVSFETSHSLIQPVMEKDILTAVAEELSRTNKTAIYSVTVTNQQNEKVALFKGTVYLTGREWFRDNNEK